VVQWLASVTGDSLDWLELPNGYLNLTTERSLSPDEARDLINRTLHARGYTLLLRNGLLSVFKFDKLDPSLIPRIDDELELYELQPHDFVKFAFQLPDDMEVDKAVEDFKQLLSPHAKVLPLVATSRVLVIDMVANLRYVSEVLNQERTAALKLDNIREFRLQHARADQVIELVYVALGMDPNSQPTQMDMAIKQQEMQMLMQMQQQGKDVSKMMQKDSPPVHLVFNRRRNSIIANAPTESMRIIAETIRLVDIPPPGTATAESQNPSELVASDQMKFERYSLVSMDPESLKRVLEEIGNLHPFTDIDTVSGSKLLFVRATPEDHVTIQGMIDELDGSGRDFHAIRLRHKAAEVVAAGIYNLMVGEEEEDDSNNMPFYYSYRYGQQDDKKKNEGFRISADVDSNSLWLWANATEMKAVNSFLEEIGEIRTNRVADQSVRTLDAFGTESTEALIERIRKAWSGKNELNIVPAETSDEESNSAKDDADSDSDPNAVSEVDRSAMRQPVQTGFVQFTPAAATERLATTGDAQPDTEASAAGEPAPINISVTEDGRLVISSADGAAVEQLEELVTELMPPPERFKRIPLKHISASEMSSIMKILFAEEMKDGDSEQILDWFGRPREIEQKQQDFRLSRRATLMFDYDINSNSLIVVNATPRQMYDIEQAVEMYDLPTEYDESLMLKRRVELVRIKYSRASTIAAAVKDAYRDLLSQTDEAFQTNNGGEENGSRATTSSKRAVWSVIHYGGPGDGSPGAKKTPQVPTKFDGALSIGVDDVANVIIVSARDELFDSVRTLIAQLDEEARPQTTVAVHRLGNSMKSEELQSTLAQILGQPWVGNRPDPAAQQQQRGGDDRRRREEWRRRNRGRGDRGGGNRN
jgi:hypothetical protein